MSSGRMRMKSYPSFLNPDVEAFEAEVNAIQNSTLWNNAFSSPLKFQKCPDPEGMSREESLVTSQPENISEILKVASYEKTSKIEYRNTETRHINVKAVDVDNDQISRRKSSGIYRRRSKSEGHRKSAIIRQDATTRESIESSQATLANISLTNISNTDHSRETNPKSKYSEEKRSGDTNDKKSALEEPYTKLQKLPADAAPAGRKRVNRSKQNVERRVMTRSAKTLDKTGKVTEPEASAHISALDSGEENARGTLIPPSEAQDVSGEGNVNENHVAVIKQQTYKKKVPKSNTYRKSSTKSSSQEQPEDLKESEELPEIPNLSEPKRSMKTKMEAEGKTKTSRAKVKWTSRDCEKIFRVSGTPSHDTSKEGTETIDENERSDCKIKISTGKPKGTIERKSSSVPSSIIKKENVPLTPRQFTFNVSGETPTDTRSSRARKRQESRSDSTNTTVPRKTGRRLGRISEEKVTDINSITDVSKFDSSKRQISGKREKSVPNSSNIANTSVYRNRLSKSSGTTHTDKEGGNINRQRKVSSSLEDVSSSVTRDFRNKLSKNSSDLTVSGKENLLSGEKWKEKSVSNSRQNVQAENKTKRGRKNRKVSQCSNSVESLHVSKRDVLPAKTARSPEKGSKETLQELVIGKENIEEVFVSAGVKHEEETERMRETGAIPKRPKLTRQINTANNVVVGKESTIRTQIHKTRDRKQGRQNKNLTSSPEDVPINPQELNMFDATDRKDGGDRVPAGPSQQWHRTQTPGTELFTLSSRKRLTFQAPDHTKSRTEKNCLVDGTVIEAEPEVMGEDVAADKRSDRSPSPIPTPARKASEKPKGEMGTTRKSSRKPALCATPQRISASSRARTSKTVPKPVLRERPPQGSTSVLNRTFIVSGSGADRQGSLHVLPDADAAPSVEPKVARKRKEVQQKRRRSRSEPLDAKVPTKALSASAALRRK